MTAIAEPILAELVEEESSVQAFTGKVPVYSIDEQGRRITIGNVKYTDYEQDRGVRGMWLESAIDGKPHSLGAASGSFQVVSPYDAISPFLEHGFQVRSVMHGGGGTDVIAFLSNPDISFPDPIDWDIYSQASGAFSLDGGRHSVPRDLPLEMSIRVKTGLRKGVGISIDVGFFRLICTNGLISRIMDLGHVRYDHRSFTQDKIREFVGKATPPDPESLPTAPSRLLPEVITLLNIEDTGPLPRLLAEPIESVQASASKGCLWDLTESLQDLSERKERVSHLDLINAITNTKLVSRSEISVYAQADTVARGLANLVELAAVRQGGWGFSKN